LFAASATRLGFERISSRKSAAVPATVCPWPATSAGNNRVIRPVAQLEA
jgi:hypothetical protein